MWWHWHMPLILGGRGSEFEISLVYRVSSRTASTIQRNPVLNKNKQTYKQKKSSHSHAFIYNNRNPK